MGSTFVRKHDGLIGHSVTRLFGVIFVVAVVVSLAAMTVFADKTVVESDEFEKYKYELFSDGELKITLKYDNSSSSRSVYLKDTCDSSLVKKITVDITGYDGSDIYFDGSKYSISESTTVTFVCEGDCEDLILYIENFNIIKGGNLKFPEGIKFASLALDHINNIDSMDFLSGYQCGLLGLWDINGLEKIDLSSVGAKGLGVISCHDLTELILPDKCEGIDVEDCPALYTCYIPASLKYVKCWAYTSVGGEEGYIYCFDNSHSLADIYYAGSKTEFDDIKVMFFRIGEGGTGKVAEDITFRDLCGEAEIHCFNGTASAWYKNGDAWLYIDANSEPVTGWQEINGNWYYFNDEGIMQTGWLKDGGVWYYLKPNGAMATNWLEISGVWYYFGTNGKMRTGWQKAGGKDYFFKSDGSMASDEYIDGYYLEKNGTWTYKFRASWKSDSKGKYYQDTKGWYPKNQWLKIDNQWYFFKNDGYMAQSEYVNGYWFNLNGTWIYTYRASWRKDSNGWWYGDANGWYAKNCTVRIDGKLYDFDRYGYCTNP